MRSVWALVVSCAFGGVAEARASSEVGYSVAEVFSTSLRFLRIDRSCKISDKDAEAAFLSFECKSDDGKPARGSLEIFRAVGTDKRERVRLQLALLDEPHYVELRFMELLERKLRDERGTPPPPPEPKAPDNKAPDLGTPQH